MSFCKHRVLDKCKKDGKLCIYTKECFEPEEPKPQTNADHIRSMKDEELYSVLRILVKDDVCLNPSNDSSCRGCVFGNFCSAVHFEEDVMNWLKQPYGGDT